MSVDKKDNSASKSEGSEIDCQTMTEYIKFSTPKSKEIEEQADNHMQIILRHNSREEANCVRDPSYLR